MDEGTTQERTTDIVDASDRYREQRRANLPNEETSIAVLFDAYDRLKELGWNGAIYCPKDGSVFEVIEAGSTGIHECHYDGEWPTGHFWIHGDGDLYPSRPILFRLKEPHPDAPQEARR